MTKTIENTLGEIIIKKKLDAEIKSVWAAFANPEHIAEWYGPQDFECTISKMEFKKGGDWELTLHGPDGTDYANYNRFIEVDEYKKIVYDHQGDPFFTAEISFEILGNKTGLNWKMKFHDLKEFEVAVKRHNPAEGLKQNIDKLEVYLMGLEDGV